MDADQCPTKDRLISWSQDQLGPADAWNLQRHVATCRDCQDALRRLGLFESLGRLEGDETVAASFAPSATAEDSQRSEEHDWDLPEVAADEKPLEVDTSFLHPAEHEEAIGLIDRFAIHETLGAGGMGIVFRASDAALDREVAIKILKPALAGDEATSRRFLDESESLLEIQHQHICRVYEVGEHDGLPFVVTAYAEGGSLHARMHAGGMDMAEMVDIICQVAAALDRSHARGIIHRNLKPTNVLFDATDNVVISDFGMTPSKGDEERLVHAGETIPAPLYRSPEQAADESDFVGPQTDVFSLAAILYELLTGYTPFAGSPLSVMYKLTHDSPPPPSSRRPDLDPGIDQITLRALARAPAERFTSALHFAGALEEWLNGTWTVSLPQDGVESMDFRITPELPTPVLGDYVLLGKIGAGGMGRVFKARHRHMERLVAVKVLAPGALRDPDRVRRFHREMKAAASLFHRNIVTAFDAREEGGINYLVMEYVEGLSLNRVVEQHGPTAVDRTIDFILQAARGLDYAHSRGVIHRDIKPSNLIVDTEGVVKILDMGTARLDDSPAAADLTQDGEVMGTVNYMSPEQAADPRNVDARADIYSLGCSLYFLLTGKPVYTGDIVQTLLAHIQHPIPSLKEEREDVPDYLDAIFQRMVAKEPEDRYESVKDLIDDLENHRTPEEKLQTSPVAEKDSEASSSLLASAAIADQAKLAGAERETPAVGIDLGTAFAKIACILPDGTPSTLANSDGESRTPCAVSINGMNVATGQKAKQMMKDQPEFTAEGLRLLVGTKQSVQDLGHEQYPVEALLGLLLANVADEGRRHIGMFKNVVMTVPAHFHEVQRRCIQEVGYIAGLDVLDIINEPTAAAIGQGLQRGWPTNQRAAGEPLNVLVIDMGAAKTDASVLQVAGRRYTVLGTSGDLQLGGRDFDRQLAGWVAQLFVDGYAYDPRQHPRSMASLLKSCEETRIKLTDEDSTVRTLKLGGHAAKLTVNRAKLAEVSPEPIERLRRVITESLELSGLDWDDVDHVLLTGGASQMPLLSGLVKQLAGRAVSFIQSEPDAVVHGAAYYANHLLGRQTAQPALEINEAAPHSLGVVGVDRQTRNRKNVVLIPRTTPLPATVKRTFKTRAAGQGPIVVHIIEGEASSPDKCTPVGKCVIEDLPGDLPPGSPFSVEFQYAGNGRLTVFVETSDGVRTKQDILRAHSLRPVDVYRWREWAGTMALCSNFF